MASTSRFVDGEKVLCFHGPLMYEAKCLKSQFMDNEMKYFIHYSGWNKNWDEWVSEIRVLKYNETNLQKQKELENDILKTKKSKSAYKPVVKKEKDTEKEPVPTTASEKPVKACKTKEKVPQKKVPNVPKKKVPEKKVPEKKVPVSSSCPEQNAEDQPAPKKKKVRFEPSFVDEIKEDAEIKLNFPDSLKSWLVDDWDLITRQKMILSLPARITVDHVVANFVKEKVSDKGISKSKENTIVQVANKIRECFNVLLGKMLLYKFERAQYAEILVEYRGYDMCQLYGAIHLLRMFTKLGELLTPIVGTDNPSSLLEHLNDFLKYMSLNLNFFSLDDYGVATPEYHRRAL